MAIGLRPSRVHGSRAFAFVTGFGHILGIPLRNPLTLSIDQSQCQKPSTYNELLATLRYAILIAFDTNGISKKPCKRPTGHTHTHIHIFATRMDMIFPLQCRGGWMRWLTQRIHNFNDGDHFDRFNPHGWSETPMFSHLYSEQIMLSQASPRAPGSQASPRAPGFGQHGHLQPMLNDGANHRKISQVWMENMVPSKSRTNQQYWRFLPCLFEHTRRKIQI